VGHPRKIAVQNFGDSAQDLTGWRLQSDKPGEIFDLSIAGTIAPGGAFFVFNGHKAPPVPEQSGGLWIYPWNYTEFLEESAFVLSQDGKDFIRLVNAAGRQVSAMPCPGTLEIPPLQEPEATPTPQNPGPGAGGSSQTEVNQQSSAESGGTQSTGASQNVPASGNTAVTSATGSTAQTGNVSGQALGGPASGAGALQLQVAGGQPLGSHLLPLSFLGVLAAAALALVGVRMIRRALRRP